jgi:hypothetical protein
MGIYPGGLSVYTSRQLRKYGLDDVHDLLRYSLSEMIGTARWLNCSFKCVVIRAGISEFKF